MEVYWHYLHTDYGIDYNDNFYSRKTGILKLLKPHSSFGLRLSFNSKHIFIPGDVFKWECLTRRDITEYYSSLDIKRHPILVNYGADKEGNCYSCKGKYIKVLTPLYNETYKRISVIKNGTPYHLSVHKFVYECFHNITLTLGSKTGDSGIHHIDGNPSNNAINNLQLLTLSEHVSIHSVRNEWSLISISINTANFERIEKLLPKGQTGNKFLSKLISYLGENPDIFSLLAKKVGITVDPHEKDYIDE